MKRAWLMLCPLVAIVGLVLSSCATTQPRDIDNICAMFEEKNGWYRQASRATRKWGGSVSTIMAFMHRESSFNAKAKPARGRFLWVFPGPRPSDAYGYSQALDDTWDWYRKSSGNRWADRDDFGDAADFIAWYNSVSRQRNRIAPDNVYGLYLAYHEGHGGFARRSYAGKPWLQNLANKVALREKRYAQQLSGCQDELKPGGGLLFF